jgi:cytochrome oxidase assembly protein ShyY1
MMPIDHGWREHDIARLQREADRRRALQEDRRRMLENAAAFIFVVLLLVLGAWLIDRLSAYNRNMACIQSHHHSCS